MSAVKFGQVGIERGIPFFTLLLDLPQGEDVFRAGLSRAKTCLSLSDVLVYCGCKSCVDDLA